MVLKTRPINLDAGEIVQWPFTWRSLFLIFVKASARGSISLPKLVIKLNFLAINPSATSVIPDTVNSGDVIKVYYIKDNFNYPLEENEIDKIETKLIIENKNKEEVGKIEIRLDNKKIGEVKVYAIKSKKKKEDSLFQKIKNLIF